MANAKISVDKQMDGPKTMSSVYGCGGIIKNDSHIFVCNPSPYNPSFHNPEQKGF